MSVELSLDLELEVARIRQIETENPDVVDGFRWFENRDAEFEDLMHPEDRYELGESESLTFLYNLLYDEESVLSKADILRVLTSLKSREDNMEFSVKLLENCDVQGIQWPAELRDKFIMDRDRVGMNSWFHSVENLRQKVKESINLLTYATKTTFFEFQRFFSKLRLNITHFQLRNLLCGSRNPRTGVFYPLFYYHDHNLEPISAQEYDEYNCFFKINRLLPDYLAASPAGAMKLDCIIDSKTLVFNSHSRISTIASSERFLASGTFEGNYILSDISDHCNPSLVRECPLTRSSNGIINHILILDKHLQFALNDSSLVFEDIETRAKSIMETPFAINCMAQNPRHNEEFVVSGDCVSSYIIDKRTNDFRTTMLAGHQDYGFGCDWSPRDEHCILTGNQDCCVKMWDRRRPNHSLYTWESSLGSASLHSGPVRNVKFSHSGQYVSWAESLDHVGIVAVSDILNSCNQVQPRVQSIDFIGKCTGLVFAPTDGDGEFLSIGVSDCPLGGIISYKLDGTSKLLDFDFEF